MATLLAARNQAQNYWHQTMLYRLLRFEYEPLAKAAMVWYVIPTFFGYFDLRIRKIVHDADPLAMNAALSSYLLHGRDAVDFGACGEAVLELYTYIMRTDAFRCEVRSCLGPSDIDLLAVMVGFCANYRCRRLPRPRAPEDKDRPES